MQNEYGMKIKPVVRTPLVDVVVERLRALIESGSLKSGDPVPAEPKLVSQMGVSRTVVREAVKRLQTDGLVTIRRGVGTYVADRNDLSNCLRLVRTAMVLSSHDLVRFIELREAIEAHAARQAAHLATSQDVAELESLCREMEDANQDYQIAMRIDLRFHLRMVEISNNQLMRSVLEILQEYILESMARTTPRPRQWPMSKRSHMAIVEAIRNRDSEAAEAAIRDHMNIVVRRLQAHDTPGQKASRRLAGLDMHS
jgi:GntR family transcriptional regulator, transcriptional repressor for pyruvate dehydrogenase complex